MAECAIICLSSSCSEQSNFEITAKLGRGKYSEVFAGYNMTDGSQVVIKILKVGIAVLRHSEPLKEPYAMVPMGALLANDPYGTAVGVR